MLGVTHFIAGAAAASALGADPIAQVAAGVCALMPDIDIASSTIGKRVPIIPWLLRHRGPTHSIMLVAAIYFAVIHFVGQNWAFYATLGWASHLLLDMLNPSGVELFWPLPKRIGIRLIRTGGILEYIVTALILFLYLSI